MENVTITKHARDRFVERSKLMGANPPDNPDPLIRKFLLRSVTDISLPAALKVTRMMNNKFKNAIYRSCEGWRFVIVEGNLITCERVNVDQN